MTTGVFTIYEVEMRRFMDPDKDGNYPRRQVEVPDAEHAEAKKRGIEAVLDLVFQYGQNDFQPKRMPSVSVGDVVRVRVGARQTELWRVESVGFEIVGVEQA